MEVHDDVLFHIFSLFNAHELITVACVCKRWNRVTNNNQLWKNIFGKRWGWNHKDKDHDVSWREELKRLDGIIKQHHKILKMIEFLWTAEADWRFTVNNLCIHSKMRSNL